MESFRSSGALVDALDGEGRRGPLDLIMEARLFWCLRSWMATSPRSPPTFSFLFSVSVDMPVALQKACTAC